MRTLRTFLSGIMPVSTGAGPRGDLRAAPLHFLQSSSRLGFNRCRSPRGPAGLLDNPWHARAGDGFNRCRSPRGPAGRLITVKEFLGTEVSTGAGPRGDLRGVPWKHLPNSSCGCFNRCRSPRGPAGRLSLSVQRLPSLGFNRCRSPRGPAGEDSRMLALAANWSVSTGAGPRGDLRVRKHT